MKDVKGKIRLFLVAWSAFLTLIVFTVYLITRDSIVLLGCTVSGISTNFVFAYYFDRKRLEESQEDS